MTQHDRAFALARHTAARARERSKGNRVATKSGQRGAQQGEGPVPRERSETRERGGARRAILDACQALVVEHGYEQLSIRRLTDLCGYTAPTIYHHFGDKRGLTDEMLEECFDGLLVKLRRVGGDADPVAKIRALLRAFVSFGLANPSHYQLLASRRPEDTGPVRSLEEAEALLEAPLRELATAGRLVSDDPEAILQSLWALAHGIITLLTSRRDLDWSPDLVEIALDSILYGAVRQDRAPITESTA
jgi:AcrR family transcriptional regulator